MLFDFLKAYLLKNYAYKSPLKCFNCCTQVFNFSVHPQLMCTNTDLCNTHDKRLHADFDHFLMRHEHMALRPVTFLGNLSKKCLSDSLTKTKHYICNQGDWESPEVNDHTARTVLEPINACDDSKVIWPWNEWRLFPFPLSNTAGCWLLLIWLLVLNKRELKMDRQYKICTTSGSKLWCDLNLYFSLNGQQGAVQQAAKMLMAA